MADEQTADSAPRDAEEVPPAQGPPAGEPAAPPAAAPPTTQAPPGPPDTPPPPGAPPAAAPDAVAPPGLALELEAARTQAAEYKDRLLRAAAELENVRRRTAREVDDARRYGVEGVLKDLLPVLDNFERALSHADAGDGEPKVSYQGIEMVQGQFRSALERHGVRAFPCVGERFDPNLHEAVHRQETADVEPGRVLEEFQRGYKIHDKLARPAMVVVSMAPAAPAAATPPEPEPAAVAQAPAAEPAPAEAVAPEAAAPAPGPEADPEGTPGQIEVAGATLADASGAVLDAAGASHGAVVTEVRDLSPAARAGLMPGDLVTDAAGRQIIDARGFKRVLQQTLPRKQPFTIVFRRGGETREARMGGHWASEAGTE